MPLKLVRIKKKKTRSARSKKKSGIDKFLDAIDVQMRIAGGEKVKQGRGKAKSWMEDGAAFGVEKIIKPKIGTRLLWNKSAMLVDTKKKNAPMAELKTLKKEVEDGKLTNRIYSVLRAKKKKSAAKSK